jgi:cytochrome c556
MTKTNEVSEALDNVIAKGDDFLGKAKDFIAAVEILLVAATGLKALHPCQRTQNMATDNRYLCRV